MITLKETRKYDVGPEDYELEEHGTEAVIKMHTYDMDRGIKLATIRKDTARIILHHNFYNYKRTPQEMCEMMEVLDSALRDIGLQGVVRNTEVENRISRLEQEVGVEDQE